MSTHRTSTNGGAVGPGRGKFQAKPIMGQIEVVVKGNWTSITAPPPEAWAAGVGGGGLLNGSHGRTCLAAAPQPAGARPRSRIVVRDTHSNAGRTPSADL